MKLRLLAQHAACIATLDCCQYVRVHRGWQEYTRGKAPYDAATQRKGSYPNAPYTRINVHYNAC